MTGAGDLDRRVEVWRDEGDGQGLFGEAVEEWTLLGSRWAQISPGKGTEKFSESSERATQAITITVRADELTRTLDPKDRLRYNGFEYDIESVSDRVTKHEFIDVLALHRSPEADRLP